MQLLLFAFARQGGFAPWTLRTSKLNGPDKPHVGHGAMKINHFIVNLNTSNVLPGEVLSRYRDPQLQLGEQGHIQSDARIHSVTVLTL